MTDKINISIPKELKQKIEKRIKETNFKSIQEYILYILEQVVSENVRKKDFDREIYSEDEEKSIRGPEPYTREEEEDLKKNLEDLGYI